MDNIAISLYSLTKHNNGNFKSEKQRAFLTSKFGQFCADDEYIVNGAGSGVAKGTTWIDTFKLSEDRSKIVSVYRSYLTSKGAKDRFTWLAVSDDEYIDNARASKLEDISLLEADIHRTRYSNEYLSLNMHRVSIKETINQIREESQTMKDKFPDGVNGLNDTDFKICMEAVGSILQQKDLLKKKWSNYKDTFLWIEKNQKRLEEMKSTL